MFMFTVKIVFFGQVCMWFMVFLQLVSSGHYRNCCCQHFQSKFAALFDIYLLNIIHVQTYLLSIIFFPQPKMFLSILYPAAVRGSCWLHDQNVLTLLVCLFLCLFACNKFSRICPVTSFRYFTGGWRGKSGQSWAVNFQCLCPRVHPAPKVLCFKELCVNTVSVFVVTPPLVHMQFNVYFGTIYNEMESS